MPFGGRRLPLDNSMEAASGRVQAATMKLNGSFQTSVPLRVGRLRDLAGTGTDVRQSGGSGGAHMAGAETSDGGRLRYEHRAY